METSSIETGSSATTAPPMTRAPAMTTLALAAGELVRVPEREVARGPESRGLESGHDASSRSRAEASLFTWSGSATKSWIVCFGFRVSYGSWKMIWTRRR
jgi:hypothetical protein